MALGVASSLKCLVLYLGGREGGRRGRGREGGRGRGGREGGGGGGRGGRERAKKGYTLSTHVHY